MVAVDTSQGVEASLVEPIGRVLKEYPEVKLALLFGSRAKGRERPDSDLDLALQGEDLDLLALIRDLSLATRLEVDVVDLSQAGHTLKRNLLRDSLVVYEGAPGAAATWRHQTLLITELDHPFFERMQKGFLRRLSKGAKP